MKAWTWVLFLAAGCAARPTPALAPATLDVLAERFWEASLSRSPTWATYLGDRRFDSKLPDLSPRARDAWHDELEGLLAEVRALDDAALTGPERVTRDLLVHALEEPLEERACRPELWDVSPLWGLQVWLAELPNYHTIATRAQADALAVRYRGIGRLVDDHVANLAAGLDAGWIAPRIGVERVIPQLEGHLAGAAADSPFVAGVKLPEAWDEEARTEVRAALVAAVDEAARPAFARYLAFLRDAYLAKTRDAVGVSAQPHGAECYRVRIRAHTGSTDSPEAIHALGKKELARLHAEMRVIAEAITGEADLAAFFDHLKTREDQRAVDEAALLAQADAAVRRAEARLPDAFGRLPKAPIVVKPMESWRAEAAPAAYYYGAPDDGSRPAVFYVNTHDLPARPLYNLEALAYHEAVPGHHLQIALAQELDGVPDFQRHLGQTAFVEGWALYAERLADELGLYSDAFARFGHLNYQAWRAARLVVDTGLHALSWSREEAVDFLLAATALSRTEAVNEIDRYVVTPGQALAYMLGRMEIERLRAEAKARLGERFEVRAFHDEVLRHGSVPLEVLRGVVERWDGAHSG